MAMVPAEYPAFNSGLRGQIAMARDRSLKVPGRSGSGGRRSPSLAQEPGCRGLLRLFDPATGMHPAEVGNRFDVVVLPSKWLSADVLNNSS